MIIIWIPALEDVVSFPFIFVALHSTISSLPCPKYLISSLLPLKLLSCFNSLSPPPDLAFCLTKNRGSVSREIRCPSPRGICVNLPQLLMSKCLRLTNFLRPRGNTFFKWATTHRVLTWLSFFFLSFFLFFF